MWAGFYAYKGLDGQSKNLKAEVTDEIYLFGEVSMNTKLLNFLSQKNITMHVFNYYGFYSGSFYPRESNISGYLLVEQVKCYDNIEKRLELAKEILKTSSYNIYRNLRYYNGRGVELNEPMNEIQSLNNRLDYGNSINEIMGIEGNIRKVYYSTWNDIIKQDIKFEKRVKRPPDNMINSLISFVNSLIYTTVLSEIYKTQLNPTISYLHEPGTKRFSLCLDIAEIFKPLIGERMIFSMLNKNQITEDDFEKESNFLYIKESGKKKILMEYDRRLSQTIYHKELKRDVSYRYLIRLECYKLIKHIIGEKEYEGFKIWW
ncbi:type I-B CRISPR-associated endonuclease Cas1b [Anaerosalibacter bizertensis]|uniref:CRISPR-associated endonuclease Cas1 n=1 Tax=Anaerosalibacter bizertensis TaxID=932217 RepID=A0A9Q4ADT7_9FIRM|nr:type I-B CRISPR-associated endonuclease Cas1b [Anaerosalibacter bizertensis]MBV1820971.1 type I-B CRISPR-associated endonuclease Cas1b [Bacteroidales bacterium MSK.15.36]MCG4566083.1 type I-B CRISPR-associated endonuclease Cas1b [Anaerosalibacter bizertensis]MCG4583536.1 type I-B CRISPR-associated endonuclease Cas1b [Anaerosalibacter bizertensis]